MKICNEWRQEMDIDRKVTGSISKVQNFDQIVYLMVESLLQEIDSQLL